MKLKPFLTLSMVFLWQCIMVKEIIVKARIPPCALMVKTYKERIQFKHALGAGSLESARGVDPSAIFGEIGRGR